MVESLDNGFIGRIHESNIPTVIGTNAREGPEHVYAILARARCRSPPTQLMFARLPIEPRSTMLARSIILRVKLVGFSGN